MQGQRNISRILLFGVDNLSSIAFGLLGGAYIAQAFGPENLGRLSTIQATSAMLVFLTTLGLDHYWVRELHRNRQDGGLIGAGVLAQLMGWAAHLFMLVVVSWIWGDVSGNLLIIVAVALTTLCTRSLFFAMYFTAVGDSQPIAISAVVSRLLALGYLVWAHQRQYPYEWVLLYLPLQAAIQALYLGIRFWRAQGRFLTFKPDWARLRVLLRESRPILLSTAIFPLFAQADVLVISHFLGARDVGIYSAATRLLPQLLFLGYVLASAFMPSILAKHEAGAADYREHLVKVARVIVGLALLASTIVCALAAPIVALLYGQAYASSVPIMQIACWTWIFMLPAALYSRLLVLEGLGRIELVKTVITATASMGLNAALIPIFGVVAAAGVSVFSYFLADFLLYVMFPASRPIFRVALRAFSDLALHPIRSLRETRTLFLERS